MSIFLVIFKWILYTSVMSSVLASMIILFKLILKHRLGVRWHYCVWIVVMIKLIVPYAPQSPLSIFNLFNITDNISADSIKNFAAYENAYLPLPEMQSKDTITLIHTTDSYSSIKKIKNFTYQYITIACIIWVIGVLVISFYTISKALYFLRKVKNSQNCTKESILKIVTMAKCKMGLNKDITTIYTDLIKTPAILGFIRPKLLLPAWIENQLNQDELNYIVLHEIAHLKRNDIIVSSIATILNILHWFNPILWYSFYRMRLDRELACDALALTYVDPSEFKEYGQTIIKLLESFSRHSNVYGMAGIMEDKSEIKRRINMIVSNKISSYKWSKLSAVIFAVLGIILLTNAKASPISNINAVQSNSDISGSFSNEGNKQTLSLNANSVTIKDIKGNRFIGKLMSVSDTTKIMVGYSLKNSIPDKMTTEFAKEINDVGSINTGVFISKTQDTGDFTETGNLFFGKLNFSQLKDTKVKEAVSFGFPIVINGISQIKKGESGWGLAPRTAIGQKEDGTVLLLVIDGRSRESIGATLSEVADILLKEGAVDAINLDGRSYSTMYYNGKVINKPAVSFDGEKIVPAIFFVLP